jgi:5-deoxy-glucuronate isomerase
VRTPITTQVTTLVTAGKDTDLIGLAVADVDPSAPLDLSLPDEALVVILHGVLAIEVDGEGLGQAGGRANVFEAQADAVYLPPGSRATLTAVGSAASVAIATAPLADAPAAKARIIKPADQRVNDVGQGNWARRVRTILGPEHEAGRLLVGETINPPGNWSSYPPHKHDEHRPPLEVQLEEVYLFKVDPPGGFGVQLRYDDDGEDVRTVRDGDVAVITSGYHPVVAAPGYSLYYLWVMAGNGRVMAPFLQPQHAWFQQSG